MARFAVDVEVLEVDSLRKRIEKIDGPLVDAAVIKSITEVTERTYATLLKKMSATVNLPAAYIEQRMVTIPPKGVGKNTVESAIVAPVRPSASKLIKVNPMTTLRQYGPQQLMTPTKYKDGPYSLRTGDVLRGIPVNMKQHGVSVEVLRGQRKRIATAFLLPLRRGTEAGANGMGVVQRDKVSGKIRSLKGPMTYQIMRGVLPSITDDVGADLRKTTELAINAAIDEALAT